MTTAAYILIVALSGQVPAQLGTYEDLASCQNAIREVLSADILPSALSNPNVQASIDIAMQLQTQYRCVQTKEPRNTKAPNGTKLELPTIPTIKPTKLQGMR